MLGLKQISNDEVKFFNTFIGKSRFLNIDIFGNKHFLTLHNKIGGFSPMISFGLNVAGFDAVFSTTVSPDLGKFDNKFDGIDLCVLPTGVEVEVASIVFENLLSQLSAILKLDFKITFIEAKGQKNKTQENKKFDADIGVSVFSDDTKKMLVGNLNLNSQLLDLVISSFCKIPAEVTHSLPNIDFEVFLETGHTKLSREDYESLEESDIIFLDDDSQLRTGNFVLNGIEFTKIIGKLEGSVFKVDSIFK